MSDLFPWRDLAAHLSDRTGALAPWTGHDGFPWGDPEFSARMLQVHLDEGTDQASRRPEIITAHVDWLIGQLTAHSNRRRWHILDAGCGPGLYCHELARRGHLATGLDIAPAALRWAAERAAAENLACRFLSADLAGLPADLPQRVCSDFGPVDAVTFWFGDFHGFAADRAGAVLESLAGCLRPGGLLILEYQPLPDFVREGSRCWDVVERSPLCPEPHLWLQEYAWHEAERTEVHAHWIIPWRSGKLLSYRQCHQGWSDGDLDRLLSDRGLVAPERHPPVTGIDPELEFPMVVARKDHAVKDAAERDTAAI